MHDAVVFRDNFATYLYVHVSGKSGNFSQHNFTSRFYSNMISLLSKDEHLHVVRKLEQYTEKLTPQELPAFVHQMLKLCKDQHSNLIFEKLQRYFHNRIYSRKNNQELSSSESTVDSIGEYLLIPKPLKHLEKNGVTSDKSNLLEPNFAQKFLNINGFLGEI